MDRHKRCEPELVQTRCRNAGFELSGPETERLTAYLRLLEQWNRAINLVGASTWTGMLDTLILDSFWLARFLNETVLPDLAASRRDEALPPTGRAPLQIWDLGAGAGLPGIPLRMLWQDGEYWMVEAREKRALFLNTVLARVPLPRTRVFRGRAEQFMEGKQADLILSRAFLPWKEVLALVQGHLRPQGRVLFLTKTVTPPAEAAPLWRPAGTRSYRIGQDTRYFCAFAAD